jgi:hypothetical protein
MTYFLDASLFSLQYGSSVAVEHNAVNDNNKTPLITRGNIDLVELS